MNNLTRALEAWREVVGPEHVLTNPAALSAAETATFSTSNRIPAIIRPGNREEVRACVQVANQQRTPIYPVSTGKNWGYGSRVPPRSGCVLVELRRLDRNTDYDEKLAYVTVEPGVTFRRLHEFLVARNSNLMLSVTGSTPDSSPVGKPWSGARGLGHTRTGPPTSVDSRSCCRPGKWSTPASDASRARRPPSFTAGAWVPTSMGSSPRVTSASSPR